MTRRVSAPSGSPPPDKATLPDRAPVALEPLARESWPLYLAAYPDEIERYGPAAEDWCVHDGKWLLAWAAGAERGDIDLDEQLRWLARVLDARGFPLDRLAGYLEILGDVVEGSELGRDTSIADRLRGGTAVVLPA